MFQDPTLRLQHNIRFADPVEVDSSHDDRECVGGETVLLLCLEHVRKGQRSARMQATALVRRATLSEHTALARMLRCFTAGAGSLDFTTGADAAYTAGDGNT